MGPVPFLNPTAHTSLGPEPQTRSWHSLAAAGSANTSPGGKIPGPHQWPKRGLHTRPKPLTRLETLRQLVLVASRPLHQNRIRAADRLRIQQAYSTRRSCNVKACGKRSVETSHLNKRQAKVPTFTKKGGLIARRGRDRLQLGRMEQGLAQWSTSP